MYLCNYFLKINIFIKYTTYTLFPQIYYIIVINIK